MALRILMPAGLGGLGCLALRGAGKQGEPLEWGGPLGLIGGAVLGAIGAQIIDWAALSTGDGDTDPRVRVFRIGGSF